MNKSRGFSDDPRFARALAPIGSVLWAEYVREKMQGAVWDECKTIISFTSDMACFVEHQGWKQLTNADGNPFNSFRAFALTLQPHGLGCDSKQLAVMVREAEKSISDSAREATPNPRHGEIGNGRSRGVHNTSTRGSTNADYLTARIARDHKDILERMKAGEFSSVRQAAIEAGIVRVRNGFDQLLKSWRKATPEERRRFLGVIHTEQS
jgi:hypothetical protein